MHIWEKLTSGGETKSNDESFRNSNEIYITLNFSQKLIKQFVDHFFGAMYIFLLVDSIEFGDVDGLFDLSGCFIWNYFFFSFIYDALLSLYIWDELSVDFFFAWIRDAIKSKRINLWPQKLLFYLHLLCDGFCIARLFVMFSFTRSWFQINLNLL